jgi:Domain of unknown function (DUF4397)
MKLLRVGAYLMLAGAAAACTKDNAGTVVVLDSLAGLRYMNFVADTTAVDFRIVDVVSYAPAQISATFRTGGQLNGISLGGSTPPYSPVAAGTRHIRVFLNGGSPSVSSTILLDTLVTFASGQNYTFYATGYARTAQTPAIIAKITQDTVPATTAGNFAFRVVHLAPTMAGAAGLATTAVDVWIDTLAVGATPVGAATFANVNFGDVRSYVFRTARPVAGVVPALNYRVVFAATGTTTPIIAALLPAGTLGTSTAQPAPGDIVALSGISAVLTSRSVAGSLAPQTAAFTSPSTLFMFDVLPPRTAP